MISGCKTRGTSPLSTSSSALRSQPPKTAAIANDTRVGTLVL